MDGLSMSICQTLLTTSPLSVPDGVSGTNLDQAFAVYPAALAGGTSCTDLYNNQFVYDMGPDGNFISAQAMANGQVFNRPTVSDLTFSWPTGLTGFETLKTSYGFSVFVSVYTDNGTDYPIANDWGTLNVGYIITSAMCAVDPSDGHSKVQAVYTEIVTDLMTGTWPITIGVSTYGGQTIVGYSVGPRNGYYFGPRGLGTPSSPYPVVCAYDSYNFVGDVASWGSNSQWPSGTPITIHMPMTYDIVTGITDDAALWCCLTAGYSCCGGGGGTDRMGFLIPRPATPTPGQESSSVPVLGKLLYFANHTFQFVNNFGRTKQ
jgi:hypothetical protein